MQKKVTTTFLIVYVFLLLGFTVFWREISFSIPKTTFLWSYKEWFKGNWTIGYQILGNIAMFIPFGFLFTSVLSRKQLLWAILASVCFSFIIECLQLFLYRGLFELDDVFNNALGCVLGSALNRETEKNFPKHVWMIEFVFVIIGLLVICTNKNEGVTNPARMYCFQVDNVIDGKIRGLAFLYERENNSLGIKLKSESGQILNTQTTYRIQRDDVNQYFLCKHDYSHTGFITELPTNVKPDEEYEIIVSFGWMLDFSTGVYLTGERVHYIPDSQFKAPKNLDEIIDNGILRVYRPDYHCWVYQLDSSLYWIVDQDFAFEDDQSTYIQYQLWTTQTEKLPQQRLENDWLWDNIGGNFEDYEIQGDFGSYRIMKRELPTEYSITSIVTGYYENNECIWKEYFRPIYEF